MNSNIPSSWKALRGNAYAVKEELKALGARWDRDTALWWVSPEQYRKAQETIDDVGQRKQR